MVKPASKDTGMSRDKCALCGQDTFLKDLYLIGGVGWLCPACFIHIIGWIKRNKKPINKAFDSCKAKLTARGMIDRGGF